MTADNPRPRDDQELWEFLRAIEASYVDVEDGWHPDSPMMRRLRRLQDRYDPSGARDGR